MFKTRRRNRARSGLATVECALSLPVLLTFTIATMDVCSAIFLKEAITIAAYEGARAGAEQGATNSIATSRVKSLLDQRTITYNNANVVTISSPGFDTAPALTHVTVTVTVPCANNLISPAKLFMNRNLTASVTVRKQFQNL